jgi:hypothetical protein
LPSPSNAILPINISEYLQSQTLQDLKPQDKPTLKLSHLLQDIATDSKKFLTPNKNAQKQSKPLIEIPSPPVKQV